MSLVKFSFTQLKRDWRAGELRLLGLALIIAVASLTSVDFFTDRVNQVTEIQVETSIRPMGGFTADTGVSDFIAVAGAA